MSAITKKQYSRNTPKKGEEEFWSATHHRKKVSPYHSSSYKKKVYKGGKLGMNTCFHVGMRCATDAECMEK